MTIEMTRFEHEKYDLSPDPTYKHDFAAMQEKVVQPMEKRIRWIRDEGKNSIESIDGAVLIKRVSDVERKRQATLWEVARAQKEIMLDWVMKGGAGLFATWTLLSLTSLSSQLIFASAMGEVACGVIFIAGATFAVQDAKQVEGWQSSPAVEIAKQRTLSYQQKTTSENILNPEEKADLLKRSPS
jgi:hypothetical protein